MEKYRLTTSDNPFNPFTQWDDWYFYDLSKGYNTCERLAKSASLSMQLPEETQEGEIEYAMDQLIFEGAFSKQGEFVQYLKVQNPNFKEEKEQDSIKEGKPSDN